MYKAVLKPGSILSVGSGYNKKYIDQLSTDRLEIHYVSMKSYLKSKYKISLQDYYNIVKYNNINHTIKCKNPECTKSTKFINLSKGYTEYCCRSCQCSHKAKLQHLDINSKLNVVEKAAMKLPMIKVHITKISTFFLCIPEVIAVKIGAPIVTPRA
jgi:hypothetical protein